MRRATHGLGPLRVVVVVSILLGLSLAQGANAIAPPAGLPNLSKMALRVSDLPAGAKVANQHYVKPDHALAEYDREFKPGTARVGKLRLLGLENDLELHQSADEAASLVKGFRALVSTKRGRQTLAKLFARGFTAGGGSQAGKPNVTTGLPVNLHIGDESLALPFRIKTRLGTLRVVITVHRVERVVSVVVMAGDLNAKLPASASRRIVTPIAQHIREGLAPIIGTPPTISGTAQVGQTVTGNAGSWTNTPTQLTYQWQHCDAAGANCAAIAGATTQTYVVQATDAGSTLRIAETATNALGTATSVSAQTAVVVA
jgi:hypothetical protein